MVKARSLIIRYTLPALADLESILHYIALQSPQGARKVQIRIQESIDVLALYPGLGIPTKDPAIRRLTATPYPYLIFYEPLPNEVIIHAIRHGARDPSSMPGS